MKVIKTSALKKKVQKSANFLKAENILTVKENLIMQKNTQFAQKFTISSKTFSRAFQFLPLIKHLNFENSTFFKKVRSLQLTCP